MSGDVPVNPTCICGCFLVQHGPDGKCHGTYGMAAFPCNCWCFRRPGEPTYIRSEPDLSEVVDLLSRIESHLRHRP